MNTSKLSLKQSFILVIKGFCMGIADVIPGISGGTIAFIMGIYEELIASIKSIDGNALKLLLKGDFKGVFSYVKWRFLLPLLLGIGLAIVSLAKLMSWLLDHYPPFVNAFFFGLIVASIAIIVKSIKKLSISNICFILVSAIFGYWAFGLIPMQTPETWWFLFLSGAIAICAMILPGISGSFILLILGKYHFVMDAVHERNLVVIAIVGTGVVCGLLTFVRLVSWLFKRYHDITIAILSGLVIGSLRKIWPWKETVGDISNNIIPATFSIDVIWVLILMMTGFAIANILGAVRHD